MKGTWFKNGECRCLIANFRHRKGMEQKDIVKSTAAIKFKLKEKFLGFVHLIKSLFADSHNACFHKSF